MLKICFPDKETAKAGFFSAPSLEGIIMKNAIRKLFSLILVLILIFGNTGYADLKCFAADPEIKILDIDDSNPFDFEHYVNEPEANKKSGNLITITESKEKNTKTIDLPLSYDSRDYGYVTPVKNQSTTGTCWAHAAMSAIESYELKNNNKDIDDLNLSEAHLTWFSLNPNSNGANRAADGVNLGKNAYSNGGNWRYAAIALANGEGANNDSDFPLSANTGDMVYEEDVRYSATAGTGLKDIEMLESFEEIKNAVITNGSAMCSFYYNSSNLSKKTVSGTFDAAYYCPEAETANHAVTITGWDDNFPKEYFKTAPQSDGAWLCKNSYGTGWGNAGYFWISYEDKSLYQYLTFSTFDSRDIINNYSNTSALFKSVISNYETYASAYTARGNERIRYISIYNLQGNSDVTVSVYKNLSADGKPESGTFAGSCKRFLSSEGFYTFDIGGVSLSPGERFSVVVSTESPEEIQIPVETDSVGVFTCGAKESYLKVGKAWLDLKEQGLGNTYIFVNTECDHQLNSQVKSPTCLGSGSFKLFCSRCGKVETEKTSSALGHDFSITELSENNTNETVYTHTCSRCGATSIERHSHMNSSGILTLSELIKLIFESIIGQLRR